MSLRRKFLILLILLTVTVAINATAALWSIVHFENAVVEPLTNVQRVLESLRIVKRSLGEEHNFIVSLSPGNAIAPIGPRNLAQEDPAHLTIASVTSRLAGLEALANDRLNFLETEVPAYKLLAGAGTAINIRQRVDIAHSKVDAWLKARSRSEPDSSTTTVSSESVLTELYQLHELIELAEGQVLDSAAVAMDFSRTLQQSVILILSVSVLAVATAGFLAIRLIRRWVLLPVSELRIAATRISQGDFDHRVPVVGTGEISSLSSEVNHMASMVKSLQEEQVERERLAAVGEMVRRISHNLRNPLSGIRSLAELSRDEIPPEFEARDFQSRILVTVDRFESWLKQLLNVSKPLAISLKDVEIRSWLESIVEAHLPAAQAQDVSLVLELDGAPDTVKVDPDHLEQALTALITNAIEASPSHGQVKVTCEDGDDGHSWRLFVTDDGPGVPKHLRSDIFRPYFTTKPDGNGIGLACVKQIVEQHGGSVEVKSPVSNGKLASPQAGSVFVLTFSENSRAFVATIGHNGGQIGHDFDHRG